jgi:chaperonin GroES
VVLVGDGKKKDPMELKVGDTVFYGKYSGTTLTIEGVDYLLMSQTDVLYIL